MNSIPNTASENITAIPLKSTEVPLWNSVHAPSTGKPSKASKSTSGLKNELFFSLAFHSVGCPLLVSPQLLRTRSLGQIDLARIIKDQHGWLIEIGEVKSSTIGEEFFHRHQKIRLTASQKFLSGLFGHRSRLTSLLK